MTFMRFDLADSVAIAATRAMPKRVGFSGAKLVTGAAMTTQHPFGIWVT